MAGGQQGGVVGAAGCGDEGLGEVQIACQVETGRLLLDARQQQVLDGIESDHAPLHRVAHRGRHLALRKVLQQAQDLDVLPLAARAEAGLEEAAQCVEGRIELPSAQRGGLVQGARLSLQKREIMQRVVDDVATDIGAGMAGDDLGAERDLDPVDIALHHDLLVGVHRRRRVVRQDPRHRQRRVVIQHRSEGTPPRKAKALTWPSREGLRRLPGIRLDEPDIGMRQNQAEKGNLLPSAPDLDRSLAEVDLGMARRVMEWNKGLAHRLPPGPDIVLHDGIAAGEPVLVPQPFEDPVRRVPLLARHVRIRVRLQNRVDDAGEPIQLGPPDRLRPAVARRRRVAQYLLHRATVDTEPPHRVPRHTSPAPRRNRQGAMSGALLRRRDRTARPLRVEHYSSAVNIHRLAVF